MFTRGSKCTFYFADIAGRIVVNETHVLEMGDDIGTCWHDLGIELKLSEAVLCNIDAKRRQPREKAREMLREWKKRKGNSATIQCLIDALENKGKTRIAFNLLGTYVITFLSLLPNPSCDLTA